MAIFAKRPTPESGLSARSPGGQRFQLWRRQDGYGFQDYLLESVGRGEIVVVPRFCFDRMRASLRSLLDKDKFGKSPTLTVSVAYKAKTLYTINAQASGWLVRELNPAPGSSGSLQISQEALGTLIDLLYHPDLRHPNDTLQRIIAYHKLFRFSFQEGSESITSNLQLRRDTLSSVESYQPRRRGPSTIAFIRLPNDAELAGREGADPNIDADPGEYQSRLGERAGAGDYGLNYDLLFASMAKKAEADENAAAKTEKKGERSCFPLRLAAQDLKALRQLPLRAELSTDEMADYRKNFAGSARDEYVLGFELVDAVYKSASGKLKSFRFPLYYVRVEIQEAGRTLLLSPESEARAYLNHLGLAQLVESFARGHNPEEAVATFFKTLLAQVLESEGRQSRVYLSRLLPYHEEIFAKTREILFGFPGEDGKGGLLHELRLVGLELDTQELCLYRLPPFATSLSAALEQDLDELLKLAQESPPRFYRSLVGSFLAPEMNSGTPLPPLIQAPLLIPGALPKATRRLIERLGRDDLVLLEGPPGTGKTFTILNLLIHCLASGKRLLIVSDQKAAIDALCEKFEEYLLGRDRHSALAREIDLLWRQAIKVVADIPGENPALGHWLSLLKGQLGLDIPYEAPGPEEEADPTPEISRLDTQLAQTSALITAQMRQHYGSKRRNRNAVSPKRAHATTVGDMASLISFIGYISHLSHNRKKLVERRQLRSFIRDREILGQLGQAPLYALLYVPDRSDLVMTLRGIDGLLLQLAQVMRARPRSLQALAKVMQGEALTPLLPYLHAIWQRTFPPQAGFFERIGRNITSWLSHPLSAPLRQLAAMLKRQRQLLHAAPQLDAGVWQELKSIHRALAPESTEAQPLSLEMAHFLLWSGRQGRAASSVHELCAFAAQLQSRRDYLVKKQVLRRLRAQARGVHHRDDSQSTSRATTITALLSSLGAAPTFANGLGSWQDLREQLLEAWPIWIVRKQAVSFLFPLEEKSFDLVIVDEATQCRVDDAMPLLFRAKRLLVVGDEKQTVLAKNSVIDDYLFREFNLDEHLRTSQARGMKGGGSHIFGLVKGIKQGGVMLDEHYRCPPEIIGYSNRYVYGSELKTMQWSPAGRGPALFIDRSEERAPFSQTRDSGQFKGIDTDMLDRFLSYIQRTISAIEAETGQRINVETDVGICYFLIKNKAYVSSVKAAFLAELGRGQDILDGAGAALQGKERDYLFYFWDVTRANHMAFRQGDEETKRRGELNVLMSRPKRRAYHFLHREFKNLEHRKASITDYLWQAATQQKAPGAVLQPRLLRPDPSFQPWRRSSGPLMEEILQHLMGQPHGLSAQYGVAVGDPRQRVDLMLMADPELRATGAYGIGIVDLAGFTPGPGVGQDVLDYYFQLQRAVPKIQPYMCYLHELANEQARTARILIRALDKLSSRPTALKRVS